MLDKILTVFELFQIENRTLNWQSANFYSILDIELKLGWLVAFGLTIHVDLISRSNFYSQGHSKLLAIEQRLFDLQTSNFIHMIVPSSSFTLF